MFICTFRICDYNPVFSHMGNKISDECMATKIYQHIHYQCGDWIDLRRYDEDFLENWISLWEFLAWFHIAIHKKWQKHRCWYCKLLLIWNVYLKLIDIRGRCLLFKSRGQKFVCGRYSLRKRVCRFAEKMFIKWFLSINLAETS